MFIAIFVIKELILFAVVFVVVFFTI